MKTLATALAAAAALTYAAVPARAARARRRRISGGAGAGPGLDQQRSDPRLAVLTVHGVRRLSGATVLYYSMGLRAQDQTGEDAYSAPGQRERLRAEPERVEPDAVLRGGDRPRLGRAYSALRADNVGRCLSTGVLDLQADKEALGRHRWAGCCSRPSRRAWTGSTSSWAAGSCRTSRCRTGCWSRSSTRTLRPWEPAGRGSTFPPARRVEPEGAVIPLRTQVQDVQKKVTQANRKGGAELDLDASVLFATDKATLTKAANAVITEAAKQITAAGGSGAITVTGHTDSNAPDAYNLTLSKRERPR